MRNPAQFLAVRMINHWNKLPSEAADSQSLKCFQITNGCLKPREDIFGQTKSIGLNREVTDRYLITHIVSGQAGPADFCNQL